MFGLGRSALDKGLDAFAAKRWRAARRRLEDAAQEEHPRAIGDYHLGLLYWRGLGGPREHDTAVACFRRAADQGHAAAQTALAVALRAGVGAERDMEEARALLRSAAGAGDVEAMTQLAVMSPDEEGRRFLLRAAEQGHPPAMRQLSDELVEHQPIDALAWLYVCAAMSSDAAVSKRAQHLAHEMSADEIAAAQKQGRRMLREMRKGARR
jgi:TPR repeat protein